MQEQRCVGEWNEETHTKELPNAQQNEDFVYDSAETFGFLALPSAQSYNTVYAVRYAHPNCSASPRNFAYTETVNCHAAFAFAIGEVPLAV